MLRDRVAEGGREEDQLERSLLSEFQRLLADIPDRFKVLVLTEIETGLRWGELIALRPRHVDFLRRTITVEETIVEVSKRISPTSERMIVKPYPEGRRTPNPRSPEAFALCADCAHRRAPP